MYITFGIAALVFFALFIFAIFNHNAINNFNKKLSRKYKEQSKNVILAQFGVYTFICFVLFIIFSPIDKLTIVYGALFLLFFMFFIVKDIISKNKNSNDLAKFEPENEPKPVVIYQSDRPLPEPVKSVKNGTLLPEKDAWETDYLTFDSEAIPVNIVCFLHYKDTKGQISKRRITIKKMVPWKDEYALLAFCHERGEHRTFKLSGIIELCDIETGEIIENPYNYIIDRFSNSPLGIYTKQMITIEPEIMALVFIARADGRMSPKERNVIVGYFNSKAENPIDELILHQEVKSLYCDLNEFNKYIKQIKSLNVADINSFLSAVDSIVETKKNADPMELAARDKIKKILSK